MEYTSKRRQVNPLKSNSEETTKAPGSMNQAYLQAVLAGKARANAETMGHRQDLAPSINAKMSKAFGMDLSQLQLYRSNAMEGTDTQGMASGNKIVLSKDIDLNTMVGQAILGHEISHVRAQSQGIGMGHTGLYDNASLEHQADAEGMMAARGQSILGESSGMDMGLGMGGIGGLTPLSAGMSASAGAPMQASGKGKGKKKGKKSKNPQSDAGYEDIAAKNDFITPEEADEFRTNETLNSKIKSVPWKNGDDDLTFEEVDDIIRDNSNDKSKNKKININGEEREIQKGAGSFLEGGSLYGNGGHAKNDFKNFKTKNEDKLLSEENIRKQNGKKDIVNGDDWSRIGTELQGSFGNRFSDDEKIMILNQLQSKDKNDVNEARLLLKEQLLRSYEDNEKKYGKLLAQMDLEHIVSLGGMKGMANDLRIGEAVYDITGKNNKRGISFTEGKRRDKKTGELTEEEKAEEELKDKEFQEQALLKDKKFETLYKYFGGTKDAICMLESLNPSDGQYKQNWDPTTDYINSGKEAAEEYENEFGFTGPSMTKEEQDLYNKNLASWKEDKHKKELKKFKLLYPEGMASVDKY